MNQSSAGAPAAAFDAFALDYDDALAAGLAATGEGKEYFARSRVEWLVNRMDGLGASARRVLDFGCGTGSGVPSLLRGLRPETLLGVDVSADSLARARAEHGSELVRFATIEETTPAGTFDLAFANGVFHHIAPAERPDAVHYIRRSLAPGALFALWENNPWNPGTRYVMRHIPFDRDALPLTAAESRRLLRAGGFEILRTDFLFIFPHALRFLRSIERPLARWPLGGQYQVLARAPR